jgi:hypothetical protein
MNPILQVGALMELTEDVQKAGLVSLRSHKRTGMKW